MGFGLLYNGKIKLRKKAIFLFCVLDLNKIKVMAEKQMRLREHIDHWKILRKAITANICSMKSHRIFLYG